VKYKALLILLILLTSMSFSDNKGSFFKEIREIIKNSININGFVNESLKPAFGRVNVVKSYNKYPERILIATPGAGVFLSNDNGKNWSNIFPYGYLGVSYIQVSERNKNLIWIGTGDSASTGFSYSGKGVFKSEDSGKTWIHCGLSETSHISKIIISPNNEDIVYVASLGNLYKRGQNRGIFKTEDGGKTWEKIFYIDDLTGVSDIVINEKKTNILYASTWKRIRKENDFVSWGSHTGIYKTEDSGKTWIKIEKGFLKSNYMGRIGLGICKSNPEIVYAVVDNRGLKRENKEGLSIEDFYRISENDFLKLNDEIIGNFLKRYKLNHIITPLSLKNLVKQKKIKLKEFANGIVDIEQRKYFTNIIGAEIYKYYEKKNEWVKINKKYIKNIYYNFGYYFGKIFVFPNDCSSILITGVFPFFSSNTGQTIKNFIGFNPVKKGFRLIHRDIQSIFINKNGNRILMANDGGLVITNDKGRNWNRLNLPEISQVYSARYSNNGKVLIAGLQDNGIVLKTERGVEKIIDGDGCVVEKMGDNFLVSLQYGNLYEVNLKGKRLSKIKPKNQDFFDKYRFNWKVPVLISRFDNSLYIGGNKVLKYDFIKKVWNPISKDFTNIEFNTGNLSFGTITQLRESLLEKSVFASGTDDGNLFISRDNGENWNYIAGVLPDYEVSSIEFSSFKKGRIYVGFNGFRKNDYGFYLFVSDNYGLDWEELEFPFNGVVLNVIKEDLNNENILYAGTNKGLFVSKDLGETWKFLNAEIGFTPIFDIDINKNIDKFMVSTFGRGIFITSYKKLLNRLIKKRE